MNKEQIKKEKLTLDFMRTTFAAQGYDFDALRKNLLVYNYDKEYWPATGRVGADVLNTVPTCNQIRRIGERIQMAPMTPMYELAGVVIAGVSGWDYHRPKTPMVLRPYLGAPGLDHVYNIITRNTKTGKLLPMAREWVSTGKFDNMDDFWNFSVAAVLEDLVEKNICRRRMLLTAIEHPCMR